MGNQRRPLADAARQTRVPDAATAQRRSLSDLMGPQAGTAQAVLLDPDVSVPLPVRREHAPAGWYKDPTGSGQLRFFDGSGWTWRTRPLPHRRLGRLGAMAASRSLTRDEKRSFSPPAWLESVWSWEVEEAKPLSRTFMRRRSGSVAGTLLLLVMMAAFTAALVASWQIWGTDLLTAREQSALSAELRDQGLSSSLDGDLTVSMGTQQPLDEVLDPGAEDVESSAMDAVAPIADPAPAVPADAPELPEPVKSKPGKRKPSSKPQPAPAQPAAAKPGQKVSSTRHADIVDLLPAGWTAPDGRENARPLPTRDAAAYGRVRIPAIGVDETLVAGTSEKSLKAGPGVWRYGALPGQPGNATIAGHRTTYGAPFNRLDELGYGDLIYVEVPGQPVAVYEVRGRAIVSPENVDVTAQTDGVRLTLSTCHPKYSARYRLVVQAEMVQGAWLDKAKNRSQWKVAS